MSPREDIEIEQSSTCLVFEARCTPWSFEEIRILVQTESSDFDQPNDTLRWWISERETERERESRPSCNDGLAPFAANSPCASRRG